MRHAALAALICSETSQKLASVRALGRSAIAPDVVIAEPAGVPGRPATPVLVSPTQVKQRNISHPVGHAALIHAIAHIEFNAINLALDSIWRFAHMPCEFYADWQRVAEEEAHHFSLLQTHLNSLGYRYGDFTAHDGLWQMAERTRDDVLARMALVPRTLEARGLDASPAVREKLERVGDHAGAAIIETILRDEIGHVAVGNRWYNWLCDQRGIDPLVTYARLCHQYRAPTLGRPFNFEARREAGFTEAELAALDAAASNRAAA